MVADSTGFIYYKLLGTIPDRQEAASAAIADELRYMKTRLYLLFIHKLYKLQACLYFGVISFAHQIELAKQLHDYVIVM